MSHPTVFTQHGTERLARTKLSTEEVADILRDPTKYVLVGRDPGTTCLHKLFYSKADQRTFVAIHDFESGAVITLHHSHYKRWCRVASRASDYARMRLEKAEGHRSEVGKTPPSIVQVRGVYAKVRSNGRCRAFQYRKLGKMEKNAFGAFVDLPQCEAAHKHFLALSATEKVALRKTCVGLIFSYGRWRAFAALPPADTPPR